MCVKAKKNNTLFNYKIIAKKMKIQKKKNKQINNPVCGNQPF